MIEKLKQQLKKSKNMKNKTIKLILLILLTLSIIISFESCTITCNGQTCRIRNKSYIGIKKVPTRQYLKRTCAY